jgi:hypothetical protein
MEMDPLKWYYVDGYGYKGCECEAHHSWRCGFYEDDGELPESDRRSRVYGLRLLISYDIVYMSWNIPYLFRDMSC